jgi:hypothetical protein
MLWGRMEVLFNSSRYTDKKFGRKMKELKSNFKITANDFRM